MADFLWVGIGGLLGSMARYAVALAFAGAPASSRFPVATLIVNLVGCALIGVLAGWFERNAALGAGLRLFLLTGVLGGFTTFSAFGLETITLLRRGEPALALAYVAASVVLGLLAVWLGLRLAGSPGL
ncbi:MAG: fluoride efflux transporter CrcB [Ramlibacter sp.]|nr:fluoride efflux transporter CrcB [Ramlibacter sp.]